MAGSAGFWLLAKLSGGMVCGVALGLCVNESVMAIIHTGKTLIGGVVFFVIPLVIFGFIAPTVLSLKASAGRMLGSFLVLSYLSSVGASLFATAMGRVVIPYLRIPRTVEGLRTIPKVIFTLEIPSLMPVVTALAFALLVGLSALWVKARAVEQVLYEFRRMMGEAISRVLVPLLPFFVAATFAELAYSGSLTRQLPSFCQSGSGRHCGSSPVAVRVVPGGVDTVTQKSVRGTSSLWSGVCDCAGHDVECSNTAGFVTMCAQVTGTACRNCGFCDPAGCNHTSVRVCSDGDLFLSNDSADVVRVHALSCRYGAVLLFVRHFCRRCAGGSRGYGACVARAGA